MFVIFFEVKGLSVRHITKFNTVEVLKQKKEEIIDLGILCLIKYIKGIKGLYKKKTIKKQKKLKKVLTYVRR